MPQDTTSLGNAVTETLLSEPVASIAAEYAEIGLDSLLSDGVLKEIPFVNSLVAITKVGLAVSDRLLVNKLLQFLSALNNVPHEKRREMVVRLEADKAFGQKVGEHILELLSRIEGKDKPNMVAKVFTAYADGKIDGKMLLRLNGAIERLPGSEIQNVRPFHERSEQKPFEFDDYTGQAISISGLAKISAGLSGVFYESADLCETFLELELDRASF
jgi:hypothetical protein